MAKKNSKSGGAADQRFDADATLYKPKMDLPRCMTVARKRHGKSVPAQIKDVLTLSRGAGRLTAQDYYYFQLYDDSRYDMAEKRRFVSERVHRPLILECCDVRWWAAADDKVLAQTILHHGGAPVPTIQTVYATNDRRYDPLPVCRSVEDLGAFLGHEARFPLFAKPIGGIASFGAFSIDAFDAASGQLALAGGDIIALDSFARQIDHEDGYVFQDRLQPHPQVKEVCGDSVSTIRVIIIIDDSGPEIIETVWKVPTTANIADNFWRSGNMLAAVDAPTGKVTRAIRGFGPDLEELNDHPDTHKPLKGFVLPHWEGVKALCLDHAMAFHKLRYQSWDIALCPEGPVVVEVNTGSAFNLSQLATGKGILTDRVRAFLVDCGYLTKKRRA